MLAVAGQGTGYLNNHILKKFHALWVIFLHGPNWCIRCTVNKQEGSGGTAMLTNSREAFVLSIQCMCLLLLGW